MARKPIVFSPEQVKQVEKLAAMLTREQMADFFGVATRTFDNIRERQPEIDAAYKRGRAEVIGKIAESLIQDALDGDTTSRIFYLKTQAGWRETNVTEIQGKDGGPIQTQDVTEATLIEQATRLGLDPSILGLTGNPQKSD